MVGFLWVPLLVMIVLSVSENPSTLVPFEGLTLDHMRAALADRSLLVATFRSVQIATIAAGIATVLGVPASIAIVRHQLPFEGAYRTGLILPMIVPGIVFGVGMLLFVRTVVPGLDTGVFAVILTHSVYGLPFVVLIVTARLYGFDETLEESARDLGAGPLSVFREITLPIIAPAVGAGFLFAWIRSFEDFIRAFFVRGTTDLLTTSMYSMIEYGAAPKMNAISTIILLVVAVALAIAMNVGAVTDLVAGTEAE